MDVHYVTPALERLWIDEVLHLHSLWHQGPPRKPKPKPNPYSSSAAAAAADAALRPANSTAFKREQRKRQRKERKRQRKEQPPSPAAPPPPNPPGPDIEWPCPSAQPARPDDAGWPDPAPKPAAAVLVSAGEKAKAFAVHTHQNALSTCLDFFKSNDSDDEDDDVAMDEDGEGEDSGVFKFFLGLFEKDGELRGYYEKSWEKGEFCCLVCGGIGEKAGKRFNSCIGLVQHSNTISKTKRKAAHRAFGRAVCQVLGWDIDRLPSIVLTTGEPLGQSLATDSNPKDCEEKEGSSNHVEETPKIPDENVGIQREDLMDVAETREIEGLPEDCVQKEGSSDHVEETPKIVDENVGTKREDLMDVAETRQIEGLPEGTEGRNDDHQMGQSEIVIVGTDA